MTAYPTLADFPVRPQLRIGESLAGWCWRIYGANGHGVPQDVRSTLKGSKAAQELNADQVLRHFLGAGVLETLRSREYRLTERWDQKCIVKWHTWSLTPRLCPLCIASSGYHCLLWDLPLVTACPLHACLLAESCHACGLTFTWKTLASGWLCACGAKVSERPVVRAPQRAIGLARMLAKAADAQVSDAMRDASAKVLSRVTAYQTRDVYAMLWWSLKLRRTLTEGRSYPRAPSWPVIQRKGARMVPGAWEVSLIAGPPHSTWRTKTNWLLRCCFRSESAVLVDLQDLECYRRVRTLVAELEGQVNPLAVRVREAVQQALAAHSVGILHQQQVCFHPRLSPTQRQSHREDLARWWRSFAINVSALDPADGFGCRSDSTHQLGYWMDENPAAAVALLNIFFEAARKKWPPLVLGSVVRRWHLPAELRESKDVLLEVGEYLMCLHKSELEFVQALVNRDLAEQAAPRPGAGRYG
ncbi:MAG: TniQ family protein [Burkholderiaceae bacterium]|nr:TniQ family protein [Burkholderiaceae bacterium]